MGLPQKDIKKYLVKICLNGVFFFNITFCFSLQVSWRIALNKQTGRRQCHHAYPLHSINSIGVTFGFYVIM